MNQHTGLETKFMSEHKEERNSDSRDEKIKQLHSSI